MLGSLTYILFSQGRGPSPEPGCSETRRLPVLKPKMLSRSLVGDWLLPTPMPCAREFKKCTGWIWKNKSCNIKKKYVNGRICYSGNEQRTLLCQAGSDRRKACVKILEFSSHTHLPTDWTTRLEQKWFRYS